MTVPCLCSCRLIDFSFFKPSPHVLPAPPAFIIPSDHFHACTVESSHACFGFISVRFFFSTGAVGLFAIRWATSTLFAATFAALLVGPLCTLSPRLTPAAGCGGAVFGRSAAAARAAAIEPAFAFGGAVFGRSAATTKGADAGFGAAAGLGAAAGFGADEFGDDAAPPAPPAAEPDAATGELIAAHDATINGELDAIRAEVALLLIYLHELVP